MLRYGSIIHLHLQIIKSVSTLTVLIHFKITHPLSNPSKVNMPPNSK